MRKIKDLFPAQTVSGSCKIDMRFMLKNKYIKRGGESIGFMEWNGGKRIIYQSRFTEKDKFLQLIYSVTDRNGVTIKLDYKIQIAEVKSNLGKGTILYFICPESGKRSKILISAYGEPKFLNREYYEEKYGLRIYYGCQQTSKKDYHNTRYFDLKRKVEILERELLGKHRNSHYRGKNTKSQERLRELKYRMEFHNGERIRELSELLNPRLKQGLKIF